MHKKTLLAAVLCVAASLAHASPELLRSAEQGDLAGVQRQLRSGLLQHLRLDQCAVTRAGTHHKSQYPMEAVELPPVEHELRGVLWRVAQGQHGLAQAHAGCVGIHGGDRFKAQRGGGGGGAGGAGGGGATGSAPPKR